MSSRAIRVIAFVAAAVLTTSCDNIFGGGGGCDPAAPNVSANGDTGSITGGDTGSITGGDTGSITGGDTGSITGGDGGAPSGDVATFMAAAGGQPARVFIRRRAVPGQPLRVDTIRLEGSKVTLTIR